MELQPVTAKNWKELIELKVSDQQTHFVASNLYSIAEAQFGYDDEEGHCVFYPFGAYADGQPVGFVMYCLNLNSRFQAFISRLMVDQQFQGKGYGREIMQLILKDFRDNEQIKQVGISYEPDNEAARKLYASLGFVEPGEMLEDETLAVLKLR